MDKKYYQDIHEDPERRRTIKGFINAIIQKYNLNDLDKEVLRNMIDRGATKQQLIDFAINQRNMRERKQFEETQRQVNGGNDGDFER